MARCCVRSYYQTVLSMRLSAVFYISSGRSEVECLLQNILEKKG